ncbi:MAG: hypothetical protein QW702_02010 [Candidatus Bathyarchaeia archaeon]
MVDSYILDGKAVKIPRAESGTYSLTVTMNAPHTITFNYTIQYYLTVKSEYGNPQGEGWYDANSKATFSVSPTAIGFLIQQVFTGWSGDSTATSPSATIVMNGPKIVIANWKTDYTQLYVTIIGIVVMGTISFIALKRRKRVK